MTQGATFHLTFHRLNGRCKRAAPKRISSDSEPELLGYLAGVLIRLDRFDGYDELVARVGAVGEAVVPVRREIEQDTGERHRQRIRDGALRALLAEECWRRIRQSGRRSLRALTWLASPGTSPLLTIPLM